MSTAQPNRRRVARPLHGIDWATATAMKWLPSVLYSCLLTSPLLSSAFTIGGNYIFELPLALAAVFGMLARDGLARAAYHALVPVRGKAVVAFALVTTLFVVGCMVGGNVAYAYGDYRANLMALFGFMMGWQFINRDPAPWVRFALCTGMLNALAWYLQFSSDALETKFASPYSCLIVAILLSCRARRVVPAFASLAVLCFLAAVSFYRQYWLAAGAGAAILLGFGFTRYSSEMRRRFIALALALGAAGALAYHSHASRVESFFMDDESRYIQSVGKTENLLSAMGEGDNPMQDSDQVHFAYFQFMAAEPWKLILPHGLGYRWTLDNIDPFFDRRNFEVITIDSLFFYLSFHYGLVIAVLLVGWVYLSIWKSGRTDGIVAAFGVGTVITIGLLFDGGQAVVISRSIWLGALVACIAKPLARRAVPSFSRSPEIRGAADMSA